VPTTPSIEDIVSPLMQFWDQDAGQYVGGNYYHATNDYVPDEDDAGYWWSQGMYDSDLEGENQYFTDTPGAWQSMNLDNWMDQYGMYIDAFNSHDIERISDQSKLATHAILTGETNNLLNLYEGIGKAGVGGHRLDAVMGNSIDKIANSLYTADIASLESMANIFKRYENQVYNDLGYIHMVGGFSGDNESIYTENYDPFDNQEQYSDIELSMMNENEIFGCMAEGYQNYNPFATVGPGSTGQGAHNNPVCGDWVGLDAPAFGGDLTPPGAGHADDYGGDPPADSDNDGIPDDYEDDMYTPSEQEQQAECAASGGCWSYDPMFGGWCNPPPCWEESDIRLKENIELVGQSNTGINIYEFDYKAKKGRYRGVMAQEVPQASIEMMNGYYAVDYSKVDVKFERIN
tara:strand:+ start:2697 stop:3905 length:1209 start_codon:yes stop_codon:yes gene_type:complete